jgi:hypothetical protein
MVIKEINTFFNKLTAIVQVYKIVKIEMKIS